MIVGAFLPLRMSLIKESAVAAKRAAPAAASFATAKKKSKSVKSASDMLGMYTRTILCIYMFTCQDSPEKKSYIGKSTDLRRRLKQHKRALRYSAFYNAIRKYSWEAFEIEILEEFDDDVTPEYMSEREKYWINEKCTMTPNGYNLTEGGEGCCGYQHSDEARAPVAQRRVPWPPCSHKRCAA